MALSEQQLLARDASRDIGQELLESVRSMKRGEWARKTTFDVQANGDVVRRVVRRDGTVEKEDRLVGAQSEIMAARANSGLSQNDFAHALGVSKRTLENWEQGRVTPSGAARRLLMLAARYPETLERLTAI